MNKDMDDHHKFYKSVYDQDFKTDGIAHGWIQWKGTQPCVDLYCLCGYHGHIDTDFFFYYYKCPKCQQKYALGQNIKLIPLNADQIASVEKDYNWKDPFLSDDPNE